MGEEKKYMTFCTKVGSNTSVKPAAYKNSPAKTSYAPVAYKIFSSKDIIFYFLVHLSSSDLVQ